MNSTGPASIRGSAGDTVSPGPGVGAGIAVGTSAAQANSLNRGTPITAHPPIIASRRRNSRRSKALPVGISSRPFSSLSFLTNCSPSPFFDALRICTCFPPTDPTQSETYISRQQPCWRAARDWPQPQRKPQSPASIHLDQRNGVRRRRGRLLCRLSRPDRDVRAPLRRPHLWHCRFLQLG